MIAINLSDIKVGDIFKNYTEMCNALNLKSKSGNSKDPQFKWIQQHLDLEQQGRKLIVKDIITKEIQPYPTRGGSNNNKEFPNFLVPKKHYKSIGVYKITLEDSIYIGSTTVRFRTRFLQHTYEYNELDTKVMLEKGGVFEIVEVCNEKSEEYIRRLEQKYIDLFRAKGEKVINLKSPFVYKDANKRKYKKVMIDISQYNYVLKLLDEKNISYR